MRRKNKPRRTPHLSATKRYFKVKGAGSQGKELKFVCDRMLGALARYLRILGYDTLYPEELRDAELLFLAYTQGRMLLTRDTKMGTRISPIVSSYWAELIQIPLSALLPIWRGWRKG
ncbi:hypothetical protein ES703_78751 [subsurface metagenome]